MESKLYGGDFLNKSSRSALKQMQYEKRNFVSDNDLLRSLSIQNREGFRGVYNNYKNGDNINTNVILSPMYNNDGTLSDSINYFDKPKLGLEERIQKKVILSVDIIKYLKNYFNLNVNFIIADKGMLIKKGVYNNECEINEKISDSIEVFKDRIYNLSDDNNFTISKMSDTNLDIERIRDMDFIPSRKNCEELICKYTIYPDNILKSLDDLIRMYGITVAYYEIDAYFKESKYIGDNYKNNIFVNIEGTSLGNKKLIKGIDNMTISGENGNGGNLLIGGVIN